MKSTGIERVQPLRVQVANQLRQQLRLGQFPPGKRLTEKGVAGDLGVSRTPAREALSMLGENSVLEILPNGGYAVPKITREDIDDIYEVRRLLEIPALQKSIEHADTDFVDALRSWLDVLIKHVDDFESLAFFEGMGKYREVLFGGCGNMHLKRNILKVDNYTESLKSLALADSSVRKQLIVFYERMLAAVVAGDTKEAVLALSEHHEHGISAYHSVLDAKSS